MNCVCVSVSACRSRSWTFKWTSHVNYLVIKTYKLPEQTGSYMPNPTREEYSGIFELIRYLHCLNKFRFLQILQFCLLQKGDIGDHQVPKWDEEDEPTPGPSTTLSPHHRPERQYSMFQILFIHEADEPRAQARTRTIHVKSTPPSRAAVQHVSSSVHT